MNENYAFESGSDALDHLRNKQGLGLGDWFKRLLMTPSQAAAPGSPYYDRNVQARAAAQAERAPMMGMGGEAGLDEQATEAGAAGDARLAALAKFKSIESGENQRTMGGLVNPPPPVEDDPIPPAGMQDLLAMLNKETGGEDMNLSTATRVPSPGPPAMPSDGRPMTSRGPALGPFPQGVPHANIGGPPPNQPSLGVNRGAGNPDQGLPGETPMRYDATPGGMKPVYASNPGAPNAGNTGGGFLSFFRQLFGTQPTATAEEPINKPPMPPTYRYGR